MAQAQRGSPSPHLDQVVATRFSPDCSPASRVDQLGKAIRVDPVGWWWWLVPILSIFGLSLGAGRRLSRWLARVHVLAGVRATTTNLLTYFTSPAIMAG